jgi:hypothetical protein
MGKDKYKEIYWGAGRPGGLDTGNEVAGFQGEVTRYQSPVTRDWVVLFFNCDSGSRALKFHEMPTVKFEHASIKYSHPSPLRRRDGDEVQEKGRGMRCFQVARRDSAITGKAFHS